MKLRLSQNTLIDTAKFYFVEFGYKPIEKKVTVTCKTCPQSFTYVFQVESEDVFENEFNLLVKFIFENQKEGCFFDLPREIKALNALVKY